MADFTLTMSASIGAIASALAKAQLAMRPALKDSTNPHLKNKYASLAACIEALRPLHENNIAVVQPPAIQGGGGVTVSTLLLHSSGEWLRGELYIPAPKQDAQGFGSALSYARRYCLSSTVGLAADDDDGEGAVKSSGPAEKKASPPLSIVEMPASPIEETLKASVAWGVWEVAQATKLRNAKTAGELLETWTSISETPNAPAAAVKRLAGIKDGRKKVLCPPSTETSA